MSPSCFLYKPFSVYTLQGTTFVQMNLKSILESMSAQIKKLLKYEHLVCMAALHEKE